MTTAPLVHAPAHPAALERVECDRCGTELVARQPVAAGIASPAGWQGRIAVESLARVQGWRLHAGTTRGGRCIDHAYCPDCWGPPSTTLFAS